MAVTCPPKNLNIEYTGKSRTKYLARIPVEHSIDDVLSPDYFGPLQANKQLMIGDLIEIEWQDFSRFGELQILAQSPSTNQVVTRLRGEISDYSEVDIPQGWEVRWIGGDAHYGIVFGEATKETGFMTQEAAVVRINALDITAKQAQATRRTVDSVSKAKPKPAAAKAKAKVDA